MNPGLAQSGLVPFTLDLALYGLGPLVLLVLAVLLLNFGMIHIRALFPGATVTLTELAALRLRRIPVALIVDGRITAVQSGLPISIDDLSTHFLAGGNVQMVVLALVAPRKAGINLIFDRACAIDLAAKGTGKTVLQALKTSVNPKVIDCPAANSSKNTIDAVAKDGIVIKAKARVTVRTNLERFVGGATEETIVARVGEGIVSTIGSAGGYKEVLENPDRLSKTVLGKALDSNTAFEIPSIDIADVDVGGNVGATLQAEQAEANKLIAQAQAEVRRAAAVATEQEMVARVVEAEAQTPMAIARAFDKGHLGVMDYYRIKNVQADTAMRSNIGGSDDPGASKAGPAADVFAMTAPPASSPPLLASLLREPPKSLGT